MIAVAIGPAVYFYKNMKPFFKYTFPSLKIDPLEKEIWRKVRSKIYFYSTWTQLHREIMFILISCVAAIWKIWTNSRIGEKFEKRTPQWIDPHVAEATFVARRWTASTVSGTWVTLTNFKWRIITSACLFVSHQQEFIAKHADKELQRLPTIVAMDTIRRNASSSSIVSYLIIASESGEIIILDTQSFSVLQHVRALPHEIYN